METIACMRFFLEACTLHIFLEHDRYLTKKATHTLHCIPVLTHANSHLDFQKFSLATVHNIPINKAAMLSISNVLSTLNLKHTMHILQ